MDEDIESEELLLLWKTSLDSSLKKMIYVSYIFRRIHFYIKK